MNEEEMIRQRKMAELQRRLEEKRKQEVIRQMKKDILSVILDKEAYSRMGNVRIANPELAEKVENYLIYLYQNGRIRKKITDKQLKSLLSQLVEKRDFKIIRK